MGCVVRMTAGSSAMPRLGVPESPDRAVQAGAAGGGPTGGGADGGIADEILIQRLCGGDAAAGEVLCKRYAQPLLRYLQRLAGDGMAEELHQQTWLSVLDNLESSTPPAATPAAGSRRGSSASP